MAPFYGWSSTASRLQSHFKEAAYFLALVPRISWYSFDRPRSDLVVLNMEPLDWESIALTTRPFFRICPIIFG